MWVGAEGVRSWACNATGHLLRAMPEGGGVRSAGVGMLAHGARCCGPVWREAAEGAGTCAHIICTRSVTALLTSHPRPRPIHLRRPRWFLPGRRRGRG